MGLNWEEQKFAIVDIETTGGSSVTGKITEVAIYIVQNGLLVDQLVSLLNPEQRIPHFIASLTGIDDHMVQSSPKFFELAKSIIEITEDAVFVAHNANFDYGFIKEEFKQLGYDYDRKTLCTVQLSRKIIPGHNSYSLGKLCSDLQIEITNRHRASGDALATVELFKILQKTNPEFIEEALESKKYRYKHPYLDKKVVDALPETSGMYCFKDANKDIIYVGKSINIKERVVSHLNQSKSKKSLKMLDEIKFVDCRETGSELIALLEESKNIKLLKPKYNRALRRNTFAWGLFAFSDDKGYLNFSMQKVNKKSGVPLTTFSNYKQAKNVLADLVQKNQLCQKLSGLHDTAGACFYHGLGECQGACIGEEPIEAYNERASKIVEKFSYQDANFIIVDRGRKMGEKSVVIVKSMQYYGHAFIEADKSEDVDYILKSVSQEENNRDIQTIINSYIKKHPELKIIKF